MMTMPEAPTPIRALPTPRAMYAAVLKRDSSFDGLFYTGVRTTGIFCRPSCRAKKPRRENVQFFPAVKDALFAGYRACLRCKPLVSIGSHPLWVKDLLSRMESREGARLKDFELARDGIDPARARRYFQEHFGMTFQAYSRARRLSGALSQLRLGFDIDNTAADAGFESLSGFRDAFSKVFGEPAGQADRAKAIHLGWVETPIGPMIAGSRGGALVLLEFTNRRMMEAQIETLKKRFKATFLPEDDVVIVQTRRELDEYFAAKRKDFSIPLDYPGTPFETKVWTELLQIPYGETRSYEDLAKVTSSKGAVRAVGSANGRNRIAIVIPCHRVVNKSGALGGYGGGLWRKQALLSLEQGRADELQS
jgi:AraC family transcriptional regulator of adaptative response/methylated-DNA-[protein]-cysteine methyltransferase